MDDVASGMAQESSGPTQIKCISCGFEAPQGSEDWGHVEYRPLGTLTQCPSCGSTNTTSLG